LRKKVVALLSAMAMMLVMAVPAMADPIQVNTGSAFAQNNNATFQLNAASQESAQLAILGSNLNVQKQNQANLNATKQSANAFAGNIAVGP